MTNRAPVRPQVITLVVIAAVSAAAALAALGFPARARIYPLTVSLSALVLAVQETIRLARRRESDRDPAVVAPSLADDIKRAAPFAAWGIGYYALIWTIGMVPASAAFVAAFLGRRGNMRWPMALLSGIAVGAALMGLGFWLDLRWPRALVDLLALAGLT